MTALFKCRCIFRTRSLRWISSTSTRKELVSFLYPAYVVAKSNTLGIDGRLTTEYRLYSPSEIIQLLSASIIIVRMKHCPQKDDLIATTSDSGGIYLFDLSHHPTSPINSEPHPQYHLNAHTGPCPGLDWSMARKECLASGGTDHAVCIWDVYSAAAVTLQPTRVYAEQKGSVTVGETAELKRRQWRGIRTTATSWACAETIAT